MSVHLRIRHATPSYALILISVLGLLVFRPALAQGNPAENSIPVVQAVMFWMEGCPHCHIVLDDVLPPLTEKYGSQFELTLIEVVTAEDVDLLFTTAAHYGIAKEQVYVPFMIIGDRVLIGSDAIPAELPGLIEQHLGQGGWSLPEIPALQAVAGSSALAAEACAPAQPCTDETESSLGGNSASSARIQPNGFGLAIGIVLGMVGVVFGVAGFSYKAWAGSGLSLPGWMRHPTLELLQPALSLIGLGVAGYLAYVETQAVPAVCGPVGDCNAVQVSSYARLFGILPIGVLGVIGYLVILGLWALSRFAGDELRSKSLAGVFGLSLAGTLFSIYLTYLEPFVIRAVCMWCLSSAVIMTLLLILSTPAFLTFLAGSAAVSQSAAGSRQSS